jgi:tetratricopeptide (TPR) repeat protein
LSRLLSPILDRARSVQLEAEAHQKWGEHLSRSAAQLARSQAAPLLDQARAQFRRAAVQYERLARLWITRREHPDALWLSAENCMNGRNYDQAVRMLARYLENETRRRRPRALVMMGEAYLALGKVDQALAPLLECIEFHSKDPDSYRARLIASQAYLERGDTDKAKELLSDNLHNEELTPKSSEWRDSLFALGQVLHRQGVELASKSRFKGLDSAAGPAKVGAEELEKSRDAHLEAVKTLCEAVERYPDAPQAIQARYSIAESHRRAAEWPRKQRAATTIETQRTALTEQVRRELEEALKIYDSLIELLNQRQDASEPSEVERAAMRNCYFARGDVLFDLERCEDAIAAYSSAANRYHDQPESLEAFIQISRCYRALGRLSEARGALEQAKVILKRIPADADFANTTHYDRNGWVQFLNWRSTL